MKIALEGMTFHAPHGVYEEEKQKGNDFVVDVYLHTIIKAEGIQDDLAGTVDYEQVYELVKSVMEARSVDLLETLAQRMLGILPDTFPAVDAATVRVAKLNPPVAGPVARSFVELEWQRG